MSEYILKELTGAGYGSRRITIYIQDLDVSEEAKELTCITENVTADDETLARECLVANGYDPAEFDFNVFKK